DRPDCTTVKQNMSSPPVTVETGESLKQAISMMHKARVDSLLVVDEEKRLKGVIDVEMIDRNWKKSTYVSEVMETEIFSVPQDSLLRDTLHKILRRSLKYVPVVDDQHRLVGIVTRASLADIVYDTIWGDGLEIEEPIAAAAE